MSANDQPADDWNDGAALWQRGLTAGQAKAAREMLDEVAAEDGVAALSGHIVAALDLSKSHPDADEYLLVSAASGDQLVAVAAKHQDDPVEFAVRPSARRRGTGEAVLRSALAVTSSVWAHGDLPAAQALAAKTGLAATRTLLQMRRTEADTHAATQASALPSGVRIRTFVVGQDEEQFLGVNARAFSWHPEQGRLDRAGLDREIAEDWFDPAGFFLAVDEDDRVLGFHWTKVHALDGTPNPESAAGPIGEIYVLAVDPESPVRGLGGPLTAAGLAYLADRGLDTVMLYVEGDNEAALKLYRRFGFDVHLTDVVYTATEATQP